MRCRLSLSPLLYISLATFLSEADDSGPAHTSPSHPLPGQRSGLLHPGGELSFVGLIVLYLIGFYTIRRMVDLKV